MNRFVALISILVLPIAGLCQNTTSIVDTSISRIYLLDKESAEQVLGKDIKMMASESPFPQAAYSNETCTELLTLILHPGSNKNEFGEFMITLNDEKRSHNIERLEGIEFFVSGRGIRLGLEKEQVVKLLGPDYAESSSDEKEILTYSTTGAENSNYLKNHNMPAYYGQYIFLNGKLAEFRFGFEYP